jgi:hypothetical protein
VDRGKLRRSSKSRVGAIHELPLLWISRRLVRKNQGFRFSLMTINPPCFLRGFGGLKPTFRTIAKGEATPTGKYYPNLAISALETTRIAAFLASSLTPVAVGVSLAFGIA